MSDAFRGRRVVVLGAGVAGRAAAEALAAEGASVVITDVRDAGAIGDVSELEALGADVRLGRHDPSDLDGADLLVASPGIPPSAEVFSWARERGVPAWGELELGARLATAPYLAVTGTNGKTTATGMLTACLQAGGIDAIACGNIGHPFTTAARATCEALVVEVSSFQLDLQTSFHPVVSVLLNLAPDHLDHHGSFDAYRKAKAAIYARQTGQDMHVGNRDDADAAAVSAAAPCRVRWFRAGQPGEDEVGYERDELVARIDRREVGLGIVEAGRAGYREDAAAAAAAALAYGVEPDAIAAGIAAFAPPAHRGEVVAEIDGVRFIDNSKATNVHAALAAIAEVRDAVLIAGGRAKGQDLEPLRAGARNLVAVVALGEASAEIETVFAGRLPVTPVGSIEDAVRAAFALATRPGVVLLAPGCASWDQFASYVERGDRFAAAARGLAAHKDANG